MAYSAAVSFEEIVKDYRQGFLGRHALRAVDHVSFEVAPGQVVGLLGPNRAGKTTLVKMLLSLCRPTQGRALRLGTPSADLGSLARVGYVHEHPAFPRYLTAASLLEYYGALSLLEETEVKRRVGQLLEFVGLADRSREPIARFSKGMVQRLAIAQALINDPELLVFDEPGEGLDLAGRQLIRAVVAEQRRRGRAVLFVSHQLADVEDLCDRIAVLVAGKLAYFGPIAPLTRDPATGALRPLETALLELYRKDPGHRGAPHSSAPSPYPLPARRG